ncbi:cdc25-like protein phosphatase twine [Drosophila tropicalis]|uniref:cdc25-like protein phosphatase twine n=1 Tax=Drosophila tropicalis TaxID=46794 RepID=UPI0035AB7E7B
MASKRMIFDEEEDFDILDEINYDTNQEKLPHVAKRYKATNGLGAQTPLQRMLKRQIVSGSELSPITELAQTMRVAKLDTSITGTPKSSTLRSFHSLSSYDSGNSLDDEYMTMFDVENQENDVLLPLPDNLDRLISGQLKMEQNSEKSSNTSHHAPCTIQNRRSARRCLSLLQDKGENVEEERKLPHGKTVLRRIASMNDADILTALDDEQPQLIGDLSKPCALPLQQKAVRHQDLKTISCDTLARLINGELDEELGKCIYQIIDCRYPYEYKGGHIRGAQNLYTKAQIKKAFPSTTLELQDIEPKRQIYIFHCEFSSERGPKLLRFLRSNDRNFHSNDYPALDYPELYLLHNGYKEFFSLYGHLCEPCSYVPMLAPAHNEEFRYFRAKTKSWQCGDSGEDIGGADSGIGGSSSTLRKSRSRLLYAE